MTHPVCSVSIDTLTTFLAEAACADGVSVRAMARLSGGAIQENWLVDIQIDGGIYAGEMKAVLRTNAPSAVPISHTRAHEFALLKAAYSAGVRVPEPLWLGTNPAVPSQSFFLMRHVRGVSSGHRVVKDPSLAVDRTRLAEELGEQLALIHSIPKSTQTLRFLAPAVASPARELVDRARASLDTLGVTRPALEWAGRWLERHAPTSSFSVLCHRDFRTGNYMVDAQGLTAILDWEFSGWGDPLEDIGWFCSKCWRFGRYEREAGGIGAREDFYRGYERVAGWRIDRDQVPYWEVAAHLNWALIALHQARRHISREQPSLTLALTGLMVPEIEWSLLGMTGVRI